MSPVSAAKSEILQGTLDLMVLNTLASLCSLHGYGIALLRLDKVEEAGDQPLTAGAAKIRVRRLPDAAQAEA